MYRFADIILDSTLTLPELQETPEARAADISLEVETARAQVQEHAWFHHFRPERDKRIIVSSVARTAGGLCIRYPDLADLLVNNTLDRMVCIPAPEVPLDSVRHALLDDGLPRLLGQRGELVVHASAVTSSAGEGLAFLGGSGWGKSTLASSLTRAGHRLITDDCLKLGFVDGQLVATGTYPSLRLLGDSAERFFPEHAGELRPFGKHRIGLVARASATAARLRRLYVLNDPSLPGERAQPSAVSVTPLGRAQAVIELLRRSFLIDVEDMQAVSRHFKRAREVVLACQEVRQLSYPRDYDGLQDVIRSVSGRTEAEQDNTG